MWRLGAAALRVCRLVLVEHATVLLVVAVYIAATYAFLGRRTHVFWFGRSELWPFAVSVGAVVALALLRVLWADRRAFHGHAAARRAWRRRSFSLRVWRWARRFYLRPERILGALLFLLLLVPFMSAFTSWKRAIPSFRPFAYDEPFTAAARAMNGGRLEWEWLQPLLGRPLVTLAIDRIYVGWYAVVSVFTICLRNFPSVVNDCTRRFSRSATYTVPSFATRRACTMLKFCGPGPAGNSFGVTTSQ